MPSQSTANEDRLTLSQIYKHALDTRNMEIDLFWKRCNHFLVLNTGLAFAYFNVTQSHIQLPVAVVGVIVSLLWLRVALGSKFWQERWEDCLWSIEEELIEAGVFGSKHRLFSVGKPQVEKLVAKSIVRSREPGEYRFLDSLILKRPSVTFAMMLLVLTFLASWALLMGYGLFRAISLPVTGY